MSTQPPALKMSFTMGANGRKNIREVHGTLDELRAFDAHLLQQSNIAAMKAGVSAPMPPTIEPPPYRNEGNPAALGGVLCQRGAWRVKRVPCIPIPGYFTGLRLAVGNIILEHQSAPDAEWETWMSLTPMERESQSIPVARAHGNVVVMGLGMGVVAWALAAKPEVDRVWVIERDLDVIRAVESLLDLSTPENLAIWGKVVMCHADALEWRNPTATAIDLLYADIWLQMAPDNALPETQRMQKNLHAKAVYYWGQELDAVSYTYTQGGRPPMRRIDWIKFRSYTGLPLLDYGDAYHNLCMRAALNMTQAHTMTRRASVG